MRTRRKPLTAILVATTALVALSACGSDSTSSPDTTEASATTDSVADTSPDTTSAATTAETTEETTAETTEETTAETTEETTEETTAETTEETTAAGTGGTMVDMTGSSPEEVAVLLRPLLLTPEEVGPTFVEEDYPEPTGSTPCGVAVEEQVPSFARTGVQILQPEPLLALLEEIRVYESEQDAAAAYELAVSGFSCGTAEDLTLGEPTDISSDIGATAVGIAVENADYQGAVILVLVRDAIVAFQFQTVIDSDTTGAPDPVAVAAAGVTKIQDFLDS